MKTNNTLTIDGMQQKDQNGNIFFQDCVTLKGPFDRTTLWNMKTNNTLTIEGMEQKDEQGNVFLQECITLNGTFNPTTLWNMVFNIRDNFPKLTDNDLDIIGLTDCHAIKHRDWHIHIYAEDILISQTGSCSVGFSTIPYKDIESMELDFYTDGSTLFGILINLVSGLQIRLF